jgi:hypothetical protein
MKNIFIVFTCCFFVQMCVLPDKYIDRTKLHASEYDEIIKNGNDITVRKVDSFGNYFSDDFGFHMSRYKYGKTLGGYRVKSMSFYDINETPIDRSNSLRGYYKVKMKYNLKGHLKEMTVYNHKEEFGNSLMNFSRMTFKSLKDGSSIRRYYDSLNKPRCGELGFEVKSIEDTVHYFENGVKKFYMRDSIIYVKDCNKQMIPLDKFLIEQ